MHPNDQTLEAPTQFRLAYIFDLEASTYRGEPIDDLAPILDQVVTIAGHLPKWWDVSGQDRETLAEMHRNVQLRGKSIVTFSHDMVVTPSEAERIAALISDVADAKQGRDWLVGQSDLACRFGYGGTLDQVLAELHGLQDSQAAIEAASRRSEPRSRPA